MRPLNSAPVPACSSWPLALVILAAFGPGCLGQEEHRVLEPERSEHRVESDHFVLRWNAKDRVTLKEQDQRKALAELERIRAFYVGPLGFPAPYAEATERYKADVWLSNQGWATGSGTHERQPAMWLHFNAAKEGPVLAHEFAHGLQYSTRGFRDSPFVGWFWESHAEWMTFQVFPEGAGCSHQLIDAPHLYYGSTRNRYCNWQFFEFLKDRYGAQAIHELWLAAAQPGDPAQATEDPFLVLKRTRSLDQAALGDHFGDFAAANVTFDYQRGEILRQAFGSYEDRSGPKRHRVARLDAVRGQPKTYRIPEYWAPQRYGYNLIRIFPEANAKVIEVQFEGLVQARKGVSAFSGKFELEPQQVLDPASDWRTYVVAVDASENARKSALLRGAKGKLELECQPEDRSHWLVVVATPKEHHSIFWDQVYYSIYRYPWQVRLAGARPLGQDPVDQKETKGAAHPNGGGFVASSARVAKTAYVAKEAAVLDAAVVEGNARIEGEARVKGHAQIRDRAILKGRAEVGGDAVVSGQALVEEDAAIFGGVLKDSARIGALTTIYGNDSSIGGSTIIRAVMNPLHSVKITGSAMLLGDLELHAQPTQGVFYGVVTPQTIRDPRHGAKRKAPEPEVTDWKRN